MHPAVYLAVIHAREAELRSARYPERPAREPRTRPRLRIALRSRRLRAA
jgi:hypothetical protein